MRRVIFLILIVAAFLRFYNLMWGNGYFFNPDERNMAAAISQMNLREGLNPHFFAYGQFPLYLAYFSYQLTHSISQFPNFSISSVPFGHAIFWLRFWSATASVLTVLMVYLIIKELLDKDSIKRKSEEPVKFLRGRVTKWFDLEKIPGKRLQLFPLIAGLCTAFTPGLIQSAHFGTTESLLTFFFTAILYFSLKMLASSLRAKYPPAKTWHWRAGLILNSIFCGLALGTKVSSVLFLAAPMLVFLITFLRLLKRKNFKKLPRFFFSFFSFFILIFSFFILSSPYHFLNFKDARGTTSYETNVALGKIPVFYTKQFINTIPIVFQFQKIFPYTIGWPVFVLGTGGFFLLCFKMANRTVREIKKKKFTINSKFLILNSTFLIYFLPNAFLFAKWTRFMTPIMPFFAIFAAYFLQEVYRKLNRRFFFIFHFSFFIFHFAIGLTFFSIYARPDVRIQASDWIYENIPNNSKILSETGNVIDIPIRTTNSQLPTANYHIVSFDFYNLETPATFEKLIDELVASDYIFIPSRRIFTNHQRLPDIYPKTARYYDLLFDCQLGFEKVAEINPYSHFLADDEQSEETWTVFDHPVIRIYKKVKPMTKTDYERLFGT